MVIGRRAAVCLLAYLFVLMLAGWPGSNRDARRGPADGPTAARHRKQTLIDLWRLGGGGTGNQARTRNYRFKVDRRVHKHTKKKEEVIR